MILDGLVSTVAGRGADLARLMDGIVAGLRSDKCFMKPQCRRPGLGRHDMPARCHAWFAPDPVISRPGLEACPSIGGHVRWRGLEVRREGDRTRVTFPDGQLVELDGEEPRWVEQAAEVVERTRSDQSS
jgi:hypothetical protein